MPRPPEIIVPVDPEHQPHIKKFVSEVKRSSTTVASGKTNTKIILKKRRRKSTGESKTKSQERRPVLLSESIIVTEDTPEALTTKMATTTLNLVSPNTVMLQEIKNMEERLKASMKENREKELSVMEVKMKNIIENSIKESIASMSSAINNTIAANPVIQANVGNIQNLKEENILLKKELQHLAAEQTKLKNQMTRIETKNLEYTLIMRGIREESKETEDLCCDKIYRELANTISGSDPDERYTTAKNLRFCELPTISSELNENEVVSIEITLKSGKRYIVSSMYRAPNTTPQVFQCCYNSLVCAMKKMNPHALIIGLDHNMDFLKSTQHSSTNDFMHSNLDMGLFPTITKPTRITKSSATLIDNIIISENLCGNYSSNILINDMSDHMPTVCVLKSIKVAKKDKVKITSRDTRTKNIVSLKTNLGHYNWSGLLQSESLDANMETLDNLLQLEIERCTPVKTRVVSQKTLRKEPWLTPSLKRCIDKNKRLYSNTLKSTKAEHEITTYQEYNKCLKRSIRAAKRLYHCSKCKEYKNNTKKLWKVVNEIIGKSNDKSCSIDYLCIDGIKEYSAKKISDHFAKYFSSVGKNFAIKIPKSKNSVDSYLEKLQSNHKSFFFKPCDESEIYDVISALPLKSSHGYDNISNILLKTIAHEISLPLSILVNQSLAQGEFPSMMKLAEVVPLFKSKSRNMETNYRPISLLTTMSKVLEKIVYVRVYKFLTITEQISVNQYGFRSKHSCEHAVGQLIGTVLKNLENNKTTISVLLDLSKAFNTIEHRIMLKKLELYGVQGLPLQWFNSYLTGRRMRVKCRTVCSTENTTSDIYPIEYGTPQGSCLGPLIFLIFVNNMSLHVSDADVIQFADDTTLLFSHRNKHYLKYCVERELEHL